MIATTARRGTLLVLVLAILLGVFGMHALASPASIHGHSASPHAHPMVGHAAPGHPDPCGVPCPEEGHPGAVCEAAAVAAAPVLPPPAPAGTAVPPRLSRLTATAAEDAAHGSGCGPPSLTALSISRT